RNHCNCAHLTHLPLCNDVKSRLSTSKLCCWTADSAVGNCCLPPFFCNLFTAMAVSSASIEQMVTLRTIRKKGGNHQCQLILIKHSSVDQSFQPRRQIADG